MRLSLLLVENPQRELWLQKTLTPTIKNPRLVQAATAALLDADPTRAKSLVRWLCALAMNGTISVTGAIAQGPRTQIRLPEDAERVRETLTTYERAKPKLTPEQRDLTRFRDFHSVEDVVSKVINAGAVAGNAVRAREVPGAEIVYNVAPYVIYKVKRTGKSRDLSPEEQTRIKAIETLGLGPPETKWCTRGGYRGGDSMAASYLRKFDMYVVYRDGKPFIQQGGKYCLDADDRSIEMPPELVTGYFEPAAAAARQEAAAKVAEMIKAGANGAPGVISSRGTFIDCYMVIDPYPNDPSSYYYLVIGTDSRISYGSTVASWRKKRLLPLFTAAGVVTVKPPTLRHPHGITVDREYDRALQRYVHFNPPKVISDASTVPNIVGHWDRLLTINKVNVAAFSGGMRPWSGPGGARPAAPRPLAKRLSEV